MLAAQGLRDDVSESEMWAGSCPACALQAPHSPSSCRWRSIYRFRDQGGISGCQSHPDGHVIAYRHLYAVPTPLQWITNTRTGFLAKLSRKQGSAGIVFKSAWNGNLNMHKTRQLLGDFTMQYISCHFVYRCIHYKLVLEGRDASAYEKPNQNIPSAPAFSTHESAVTMQWKIMKETNLFGSLNWVFFSSGKKQQDENIYARWLQSGLTNLLKSF